MRFNRNYKSLGITAGSYCKVNQIYRKADTANHIPANTVELITPQGTRVFWNPDKVAGKTRGAVEVYEAEERTLLAGNKIRWTKNDYASGIINSQFANVLQVDKANALVELDDGTKLTLDLNQHTSRHWEHAYATTIHNAQGLGGKTIIGNIDSGQKNLSTLRAFYVLLSRAEENAYLFVDDIKKAVETIKMHTGEKLNAVEVLHYYEALEQIELTIKNAPEKIQGAIYELSDNYQRYMTIAEHYVSFNPHVQDNVLCLINQAKDRQVVNQFIRRLMHKQGELGNNEINAKGLVERDLRDLTDVTAYRLNHIVCFHKHYKKLDAQAQEHLTIVAIDEIADIVTLARADGSTLQWQPKYQPRKNKHYEVSVYYALEQPLRVGDNIRFTEDNKENQVKKGQTALVTNLTAANATVHLKNGQVLQLDLTQPQAQHWTYQYCQGLYDKCRKLPQHVIAHFDEQVKSTHQQRKLLSLVGQAKKSACVYTHSEAFVIDKVQRQTHVQLTSHQAQLNQALQEVTSQVVNKWQPRLQLFSEQTKRHEAIIAAYFNQADAAILAMTPKERYQLSQGVRTQLKRQGVLYGQEVVHQALVQKALSKEALGYAVYYQVGDIIHFTKDYPLLAIRGDTYYKTKEVDVSRNKIEITADKQTLCLAASQIAHKHRAVSLYQLEERPLMLGDSLRFTQGDKRNQVVAVSALNDYTIEVTTVTGELFPLTAKHMQDKHWEYACLASIDSSHKKTLLVAYPQEPHFESVRTLYQLLSKTKQGIIYAANKAQFTTALTNEKDYAVLALLQRYEIARTASQLAWFTYFSEKEPVHLSQAKILQQAKEEQAYQLLQVDADETLIKALRFDKQKIDKEAFQHARTLQLNKFLQETRPLHHERLAHSLAQQLADFYPLLTEKQIDVKNTVLKAANRHQHRLESLELSRDERQYKHQVEQYLHYRQQAARYWQAITIIKEDKGWVSDYLIRRANTATLQRNQLAHRLYQHPEHYQRHIGNSENKQLIEKHGVGHSAWLKMQAKRKQALQTQDWKLVLKSEQQPSNSQQTYTLKKSAWDKHAVLKAIMPKAESILTELLGKPPNPTLSRSSKLVWNQKDPVTLYLRGVKSGLVTDFENGFQGNLISYVAMRRGIAWQQALDELAKGLSPLLAALSAVQPALETQQRYENAAKEEAKHRMRAIRRAERLWEQSIPITKTLAEQYLRKHCAISADLNKTAFRFHPKAVDYEFNERGNYVRRVYRPALMVAGYDEQGKVTCVQTTYLEQVADKNRISVVENRIHGANWGYAAKIQAGKTKQVIFATSVESAASLIAVKPDAHIYLSLGNLNHLAYVAKQVGAKEVLLATDNNKGKINFRAWEGVLHAADKLSREGLTVFVAKPDLLPGDLSTDFNDLLKAKGLEAVKDSLEKAHCLAYAREMPAEFNLTVTHDSYIPDIDLPDIASEQSYDYLATWIDRLEPIAIKSIESDDGISI